MGIWFVGLAVNLAINLAFLPGRGAWVAALASSISYALLLALHMWLFARDAGGFARLATQPSRGRPLRPRRGEPRLMELVPRENIYGHRQRLYWLRHHLRTEDRAVEFGCGTGRLITIPLRAWGYDVTGVDLDETSIAHGREVLEHEGLDPDALQTIDLRERAGRARCRDRVRDPRAPGRRASYATRSAVIREKLKPGGKLLVTTPNGYSLFELENLLWYRTGVDRLYRRLAPGGSPAGCAASRLRIRSGRPTTSR